MNYASNPAELPKGTLVDLFLRVVDRFPDRVGLRDRRDGRWDSLTFAEVEREVSRASAALRALGLRRGDRAAILSPNRSEWAIADYGCLCSGVADVPIYSSLTAEQIAYILRNSEARLIFVADEAQLAKIREIRSECPALEHVVVFDPPADGAEGAMGWKEFLDRGGAVGAAASSVTREAFRAEARLARPEDVATILYTSGTTGDPKGVMLTHDNVHSNVTAASRVLPLSEADSTLSFLPLSHVFQRTVDYLLFGLGCEISYCASMDRVSEYLKEVRPTLVVSVPRLYEKVYARVLEATGPKGALVKWAVGVGDRRAEALLRGARPGAGTALLYRIADLLVFRKIKRGLGGRLRYFVSGGGPLAPEINRFFFSAGIVILEGYGLTETSPVTNVNSPNDFPNNFRIGTVGKAVSGTEIRIAEDGEIFVRGRQVMKGYLGDPERTREAITDDGWFRTGDIGEIDPDGFLRITDRKKDIIVTAGGKNVAPQPIENDLKRNPYVDQPILLGDRRKFLSLLLVPNFERLEEWAKGQGIGTGDRGALLADRRVQRFVETTIEAEMDEFSRVERPKKILLLERGFTVEDGSLTPTQKIKRKVVEARYRHAIDGLYDEANRERTVFTLGDFGGEGR